MGVSIRDGCISEPGHLRDSSPRRFLTKSSSFIFRSGLTLGLYMSVLSRMMAKAKMKMVSGFRNCLTTPGLQMQYRWLKQRRRAGSGTRVREGSLPLNPWHTETSTVWQRISPDYPVALLALLVIPQWGTWQPGQRATFASSPRCRNNHSTKYGLYSMSRYGVHSSRTVPLSPLPGETSQW